ncbi:hypothetical protein D3C71_607690 [compost metagenome]
MSNKAKMVGWALSPTGYQVAVYDEEMQPLHEETYGNHPMTSTDVLPADDEHAVGEDKLTEWAEKTALELAGEWGVDEDGVFHDTDLEASLGEEQELLHGSRA